MFWPVYKPLLKKIKIKLSEKIRKPDKVQDQDAFVCLANSTLEKILNADLPLMTEDT